MYTGESGQSEVVYGHVSNTSGDECHLALWRLYLGI